MSVEGWITLAGLAVQALIFSAIFRKAGFTGWLALLMVLPLVNLITLVWFASTTWPVETAYHGQRETGSANVSWELKMAVRRATELERRGEFAQAAQEYEHAAARAGAGHPSAATALERARELRAKAGV